jgi:hypothetical protein
VRFAERGYPLSGSIALIVISSTAKNRFYFIPPGSMAYQRKYMKKDGNFTNYRTGRPGTDYIVNVTGQLNTCTECGREYLMEDALQKRWHLYQGHCESCGNAKKGEE